MVFCTSCICFALFVAMWRTNKTPTAILRYLLSVVAFGFKGRIVWGFLSTAQLPRAAILMQSGSFSLSGLFHVNGTCLN